MRDHRIVINPGHSRTDSGAIGPTGLKEAEVARAVAQRLVALSDEGPRYEPKRQPPGRGKLSVLLKTLRMNPPEALVSLHCNSAEGERHECRVYWWREHGDARCRTESARLAGIIANEAMSDEHHFAERGRVMTAPYARGDNPRYCPGILKYTATLAVVIVELGFISDVHVEAAMRTEGWLTNAAAALDTSIRSWLDGFTPS